MRKLVLFSLFALSCLMMSNCGNKSQQLPVDESIDSTAMMLLNQNKTVFGICCSNDNDSILQMITDSGDTLNLSLREAIEKGTVFGSFESGDKMAVIPNEDKSGVSHVISETQLQGDWVMPNPLDGSSIVGISLKEGGVAESIEQSTIIYKSWRIVDGKIEITLVREGGGDEEEINIYDIVKLDSDSLIYANEEDRMEYSRQ